MRASMAYLAGAGTIVVAISIGLGGGLVAGNIMNPHQPKQGPASKVERQVASVAQAAAADTSEVAAPSNAGSVKAAAVAPVPYAQATQRAGFVAEPLPSANSQQEPAKAAAPPPDRTVALSNAQPEPAASPPASSASVQEPQEPQQAQQSQQTQPQPQQAQPATSQPSKPEQAYAKASASDVKREARERRRAERHQHWVQRHRRDWRERDNRDPREARAWRGRGDRVDWTDVDRSIRDDDQRDYAGAPRAYPQFRLFGED